MLTVFKVKQYMLDGYIKSQIALSNFEGVVQIWDVIRSQVFLEMKENEKCVWSVDFSLADSTMLASGSDDGSVKLWNINQEIVLFLLVGEDTLDEAFSNISQWVSGEDTSSSGYEGLNQLSEGWLANCLTDAEV
ncbi:hypothetical protein AgCh_027081 [Apium graveolens]